MGPVFSKQEAIRLPSPRLTHCQPIRLAGRWEDGEMVSARLVVAAGGADRAHPGGGGGGGGGAHPATAVGRGPSAGSAGALAPRASPVVDEPDPAAAKRKLSSMIGNPTAKKHRRLGADVVAAATYSFDPRSGATRVLPSCCPSTTLVQYYPGCAPDRIFLRALGWCYTAQAVNRTACGAV